MIELDRDCVVLPLYWALCVLADLERVNIGLTTHERRATGLCFVPSDRPNPTLVP